MECRVENKTNDILNIAKGLAIIFVVFGHTIIPSIRDNNLVLNNVWTIIYLFHMPVFFFISGYLFEKNSERYFNDKKGFILKKIKLLIVPYLFISFCVYLLVCIISLIPNIYSLIQQYGYSFDGIWNTLVQILTYENHIAQHLWYILSLFIIFIINILIPKYRKTFSTCIIIISLISLPICKHYVPIPDIIEYTIFNIPFFMLGCLVYGNCKVEKFIFRINIFPLIFIVFSLLYIFGIKISNEMNPLRWIYMFSLRVSGIFGFLSVCALLAKISKIKLFLSFVSKKSYCIYLYHQPFLVSGLSGILVKLNFPFFVICILVTIIGLVIPIILSYLLEKNKIIRMITLGGH